MGPQKSFFDFTETFTGIITTRASTILDVRGLSRFAIQSLPTATTPSAVIYASATDIDNATEQFTGAHDFTTGLKGQFTTSNALPTGLSTSTDYFVIVVSSTVVKFASSLNNALAGTAINITSNGTGNQTFTPTSIAGATATLRKSNKESVLAPGYTYTAADFTDVATGASLTSGTYNWVEIGDPAYRAAVLVYGITAGRLTAVNYVLAQGEV